MIAAPRGMQAAGLIAVVLLGCTAVDRQRRTARLDRPPPPLLRWGAVETSGPTLPIHRRASQQDHRDQPCRLHPSWSCDHETPVSMNEECSRYYELFEVRGCPM